RSRAREALRASKSDRSTSRSHLQPSFPWLTGTKSSPSRRQQKTSKLERVMSPVRVIDRTHPLFGKTLSLLSERCGRGKAFIAVALQDGRRRLVPRSATDLDSG